MGQFGMDALFEITSGKHHVSVVELRDLQNQARAGEKEISELHSEVIRSAADAERRMAVVSSKAAHGSEVGSIVHGLYLRNK